MTRSNKCRIHKLTTGFDWIPLSCLFVDARIFIISYVSRKVDRFNTHQMVPKSFILQWNRPTSHTSINVLQVNILCTSRDHANSFFDGAFLIVGADHAFGLAKTEQRKEVAAQHLKLTLETGSGKNRTTDKGCVIIGTVV